MMNKFNLRTIDIFNIRNSPLTVLVGPVKSRKSGILIELCNDYKKCGERIAAFHPSCVTKGIESRNGESFISTALDCINDIKGQTTRATVIAIDEAQFFDSNLVTICETLANSGLIVIVAGLDMDWQGHQFGCIGNLMIRAEFVIKLKAVCHFCRRKASRSVKIAGDTNKIIEVNNGNELYEPACRECFVNCQIKQGV